MSISKTLVLTKEKKMRLAKLIGLALSAAMAIAAFAIPAIAAQDPEETLALPDIDEKRALIAGSIGALSAMVLRIGKSLRVCLNTSLAQDAKTAVTTQRFAPRATTVSSRLHHGTFTNSELSTTGVTGIDSLQVTQFENQLPNPQYDRKTWSINRILAC